MRRRRCRGHAAAATTTTRTKTSSRSQSRRRRRGSRSRSRSRSRKMLGAGGSRRRRFSSGRRVVVSGGEFGALAAATAAGLVGLGAAAATWKARAAQKQQQESVAIEPSPPPPRRPEPELELEPQIKRELDLAETVYNNIKNRINEKASQGNADKIISENANDALQKIEALNSQVRVNAQEKDKLISNIFTLIGSMENVEREFDNKHRVLNNVQHLISSLTKYKKENDATVPRDEGLANALDAALAAFGPEQNTNTKTIEELERSLAGLRKNYAEVRRLRSG